MDRWYFAYGSNMSTARLLARIPEAASHGGARLADWQLAFDKPSRDGSAKANIAPIPGRIVWGVVWAIPEEAWPTLDRYEPDYERIRCTVTAEAGGDRSAATYVYRGQSSEAAPFDWYVEHLLVGAREHGLPADYQRHLGALRPTADPAR